MTAPTPAPAPPTPAATQYAVRYGWNGFVAVTPAVAAQIAAQMSATPAWITFTTIKGRAIQLWSAWLVSIEQVSP